VDPEGSPPSVGGPERDAVRAPALAALAGLGVAIVSLPLAALDGAPYLSVDHVNGWIVVFAIGLFAALFAAPFVIERLMRVSRPGGEERWERALLVWGAVAAVLLAVAILVGLAGSFSSSSLAGTVGLVAAAEAALVLGTLLVLLLSS
jgi:hypothetical protein